MTHGDSLAMTVEATHRSLENRLAAARAPGRDRPRDTTDAFLAATSRHLAAAEAVLVPTVRRRVSGGVVLSDEYLAAARELEQTLTLVKARLYGEAHAIQLSWDYLWGAVQRQLSEHNRLELSLVDALVRDDEPGDLDGLAQRVFVSETRGPTRPHPHLPHTGVVSLVARRLWAIADRFWDRAEGRVIPEPVHPVSHRHDSLFAQYLVGDPHFDKDASVIAHRHRDRYLHAGRPIAGSVARTPRRRFGRTPSDP
jgi:hypothetical protein